MTALILIQKYLNEFDKTLNVVERGMTKKRLTKKKLDYLWHLSYKAYKAIELLYLRLDLDHTEEIIEIWGQEWKIMHVELQRLSKYDKPMYNKIESRMTKLYRRRYKSLRKINRMIQKIEYKESDDKVMSKMQNYKKQYLEHVKKRRVPKKLAKFAVVNHHDDRKSNHALFLGYFETLEEANKFAYKQAYNENPSEGIFFFGSKKELAIKPSSLRTEENVYYDDERPYKNEIIGYKASYEVYSVVKPFPGVENESAEDFHVHTRYYPDAYFPSNKIFPHYGDSVYGLRPVYYNMKTMKKYKLNI